MTRVCTGCYTEKPISEFTKDCNVSDGVSRRCKACKSTYRKAHPETDRHNRKLHKVIHISHPQLYNPERMPQAHIYCSCATLSDAHLVASRLKDSNKPYIIAVTHGYPDNGKAYTEPQRCFTVLTEPFLEADWITPELYDELDDEWSEQEFCPWDTWVGAII
jgi:hypothetical protein